MRGCDLRSGRRPAGVTGFLDGSLEAESYRSQRGEQHAAPYEEARMAELQVEGDELVLHLSRLEKLEAVHGDLRVPLSAVRGVDVIENAHEPADHGFKTGERVPGVSEVATVRTGGKRIFAAVHNDTPRGLRVLLEDVSYDEWIVGCTDPEGVKSRIGEPR
jgi:hypothetical protein